MKQVYLVDVDGTLTKNVAWTPQEALQAIPNKKMINYINKLYLEDFIVIRTARRHEMYASTIEWLNKNNVRYHAVSFDNQPGIAIDCDAINKVSESGDE